MCGCPRSRSSALPCPSRTPGSFAFAQQSLDGLVASSILFLFYIGPLHLSVVFKSRSSCWGSFVSIWLIVCATPLASPCFSGHFLYIHFTQVLLDVSFFWLLHPLFLATCGAHQPQITSEETLIYGAPRTAHSLISLAQYASVSRPLNFLIRIFPVLFGSQITDVSSLLAALFTSKCSSSDRGAIPLSSWQIPSWLPSFDAFPPIELSEFRSKNQAMHVSLGPFDPSLLSFYQLLSIDTQVSSGFTSRIQSA